jgi:hypothetical protein
MKKEGKLTIVLDEVVEDKDKDEDEDEIGWTSMLVPGTEIQDDSQPYLVKDEMVFRCSNGGMLPVFLSA